MRLLILFILGFAGFFFIGELLKRASRFPYSIFGLILLIVGFLIGFLGQGILGPPINTLVSVFLLGGGAGLIIHHALSMRYIIAPEREKRFLLRHEDRVDRICEMIPGALVWIALTSPFWLSITLPFAVAYILPKHLTFNTLECFFRFHSISYVLSTSN